MYKVEKLSNNFAKKIARQLNYDEEKTSILQYGAFALIQTILSIFIVIVFGMIFDIVFEALIISFTASILRKYSGGAHASSPMGCLLIGTIVTVGEACIIVYLLNHVINLNLVIIFGLIIFISASYGINKLAPVDNPAKPIKSSSKKIRMKRKSMLVLYIYGVITIINLFLFYFLGSDKFNVFSLCIYGGISWQVFTLTKAGCFTLKKVDMLLENILNT